MRIVEVFMIFIEKQRVILQFQNRKFSVVAPLRQQMASRGESVAPATPGSLRPTDRPECSLLRMQIARRNAGH